MFMAHKRAEARSMLADSDDEGAAAFAPYGRPHADQGGAAAPAYEKWLSPQARSVLEDARTWSTTQHTHAQRSAAAPQSVASATPPESSPRAALRSPGRAPDDEEEGGYDDDFESAPPSSRATARVGRGSGKDTPGSQQKADRADASPRLGSEVADEDMDFLLAGLT